MQITDSTLEKAVFRILREHDLVAHSSIPFRELQGLWAYTGLRQGDLRDALRIMFDRNYIDFDNNQGHLAVVLSPEGFQRSKDHELHLNSLLRDALDKIVLHKAEKRYHRPSRKPLNQQFQRSSDASLHGSGPSA